MLGGRGVGWGGVGGKGGQKGITALNSLPMVCDSDSYEFRGLCSQGMAASIHKYRLHRKYFIGILGWMNMINPLIFFPLLLKKKKEGLKAVTIENPLNLPNISGEKTCVLTAIG